MTDERTESAEVPTVLYIVGCGRSGSTLAERMLGAIPQFSNIGELARLFASVATQDQRCGCGSPFSRCPFWRSVGDEALDGWDPSVIQRVITLQQGLIRHRFVPYLLAPGIAPASFRTMLAEYVETYRALYAAAGKVSGARVLVDASKSPAQLLALMQTRDLDLRVLNIVRDARGVAHSWSKQDVRKPHDNAGVQVMRSYPPPRTAMIWSTIQVESMLLRARSAHGAVIRYEDLVANPRRTLHEALAHLGLPVGRGSLDHIEGRVVTLGASHGISGNPSRFTAGRVELRQDVGWQSGLSRRARRSVTTLTFPQLVQYGYIRRRKAGAP